MLSQSIKTKRGKYGVVFFGKSVRHPGTKAYPFMNPAAEGGRR